MKKVNKLIALVMAVLMIAVFATCCTDTPANSASSHVYTESELASESQNMNNDDTASYGYSENETVSENENIQSNEEDDDMGSEKPTISRPDKDNDSTSSKKSSSNKGEDKITNVTTSSKKQSNSTSSKKNSNSTSSKKDSASTSSGKKPSTSTSSKAPSTNTSSNTASVEDSKLTYTPVDVSGMTELQKAIVLTAESYFLRGTRLQYEDTRFVNTKYLDLWRWGAVRTKTIEDYTTQNIQYSNCAAFTHDVYYNALGFNITQYTTSSLVASSPSSRVEFMKKSISLSSSSAKEAFKKEFLDTLEPGDLMVYLRSSGTGHVMLYVGNNMMIDCSGSSYDWTNKKEKTEAGIRNLSIDRLFDESGSMCLYDMRDVAIIRPLNDFSGTIPAATKERMDNMRGVVAEKLASVDPSVTVNPGDEITFTFNIENYSNTKKTFKITDVVPENTTYVSGAESKSGDNLSWNVTVDAGKSKKVSYKVKVSDGALGKTIYGTDAKIGSITLRCHKIYVKKTLTSAEQTKIKNAANSLKNSDLRNIALADAIYKEALGESNLGAITSKDILNGVFVNYSTNMTSWPSRWKKLTTSTSNKFYNMMAPDLYGGRQLMTDKNYERVRLVTANKLVVGDIIITSNPTTDTYEDDGKSKYIYAPVNYMFLGDRLLDLTNMKEVDLEPKLEQLLCEKHFVVIRPSISL